MAPHYEFSGDIGFSVIHSHFSQAGIDDVLSGLSDHGILHVLVYFVEVLAFDKAVDEFLVSLSRDIRSPDIEEFGGTCHSGLVCHITCMVLNNGNCALGAACNQTGSNTSPFSIGLHSADAD